MDERVLTDDMTDSEVLALYRGMSDSELFDLRAAFSLDLAAAIKSTAGTYTRRVRGKRPAYRIAGHVAIEFCQNRLKLVNMALRERYVEPAG